jgi:hypothetical protein
MTASNDPSLTLAFRANDDGGQILWPVMKVLTNRTIDWTRCAAWLNPPTNGWLFGRLSVSSNGVLVGGNITNINLAGHFSITTNDVGCLTISPAGFSGVVSNSGHYLRYEGGILVSTNWP